MKVRNGFVSNSSSSSFTVIGGETVRPEQMHTYIVGAQGETEFGWQCVRYEDVHSRINFAYLQAKYAKVTAWEDMLDREVKKQYGADDIMYSDYIRDGYIDHQSCAAEGVNTEMFENEEILERFLFGRDSFIQGGNDNG